MGQRPALCKRRHLRQSKPAPIVAIGAG